MLNLKKTGCDVFVFISSLVCNDKSYSPVLMGVLAGKLLMFTAASFVLLFLLWQQFYGVEKKHLTGATNNNKYHDSVYISNISINTKLVLMLFYVLADNSDEQFVQRSMIQHSYCANRRSVDK